MTMRATMGRSRARFVVYTIGFGACDMNLGVDRQGSVMATSFRQALQGAPPLFHVELLAVVEYESFEDVCAGEGRRLHAYRD